MQSQSRCPPPSRFTPVGELDWAQPIAGQPPFINRKRRTGRRAQGIRYEKRVHGHFQELYGEQYLFNQWFQFCSVGGAKRWCELDGLLVRPSVGRVTIVEVKYQHTSDAWWQLRHLYLPVVKRCFGNQWDYSVCEVVKWYDPATQFPEKVRMSRDIQDVTNGDFGLHIWRP